MLKKCTILALLLLVYLVCTPTPAYSGCGLTDRLTFHFFHSNIWHLMANGLCIWVMKRIRWVEAYVIAVVCSACIVHPTVGISGLIFAAIGLNLGAVKGTGKWLARTAVYAVVFGLLPGVSMVFHLTTLCIGFLWGRIRMSLIARITRSTPITPRK